MKQERNFLCVHKNLLLKRLRVEKQHQIELFLSFSFLWRKILKRIFSVALSRDREFSTRPLFIVKMRQVRWITLAKSVKLISCLFVSASNFIFHRCWSWNILCTRIRNSATAQLIRPIKLSKLMQIKIIRI